ncbi:helix-turn-helix domain-containing protein [Actinomadura alba]|uniref:helix-turn-helix domain-containing protein n=1 Tax=Actinomadura alba TaxID=406431 RepID=UPI001FE8EC80|nr:helix-turn-helix domain-containing protein [Actinomadura alba]
MVWLRYSFRLDPTPGQRIARSRAFGCARTKKPSRCRMNPSGTGESPRASARGARRLRTATSTHGEAAGRK